MTIRRQLTLAVVVIVAQLLTLVSLLEAALSCCEINFEETEDDNAGAGFNKRDAAAW